MKYINLKKIVPAVIIAGVAFYSCKKVDTAVPLGTAGQTIVKLVGNQGALTDPGYTDIQQQNIELKLVTTPFTYDVVDIRRDVPNSKSMNTTMNVKVKLDPGIVTLYNSFYGTSFVSLPDSLVTPSTPLVGNTYNITLNPGELAKPIQFTISNGTKLDLSKFYAMGFSIVSADGDGKVALNEKKVIVTFGVRNQWDGMYSATGTMVDVTNPAFLGTYPETFYLITTGASSNAVFDPNLNGGTYGHTFDAAGSPSYYGSYAPVLTFDAATNKITGITNYYGQNSGPSVRSAALDPTGANSVNPATKDITIKYQIVQGTGAAFVGTRVTFNEVWKYMGPRP
ncbi:MAG: DUF1735 domain-containing protein [Ferruginibacter sp.]